MHTAQESTRFRLGLLLCLAVVVFLVWPVTNDGMIVNADAPRHLLRVKVMAEQFLPSGHVDGWSPYWYLGAQLFLFQSYGYFLVIGLAALLLDGVLDLLTVFKVFYALPVVALPLVVAHVARRLGVSRDGAVVAAMASLVLGTMLGFGMPGLFVTGLLPHSVGVLLFALAWPVLLDALDGVPGQLWKAVLLMAAALLAHFITGAYALAVAGLVAAGIAVVRRDPGLLVRYAAIAALVLLLAGHALFPSLQWHELGGGSVGWGEGGGRAVALATGGLFGPRALVLPAYAAAIWAVLFDRSRLAITAAVALVTAVLAVTGPFSWEPQPMVEMMRRVVRPRALSFVCLATVLFTGVAFDKARPWLSALARRSRPGAAVVVAAVLVIVGSAAAELAHHRRNVETEYAQRKRPRKEFARVVRWLDRKAEHGAIVAMDRTAFRWARLGVHSVVSVLNFHTGVYTLGGDQVELTSAGRRGDLGRIMRKGSRRGAERLRRLGIRYVIVTSQDVREFFEGSDDFVPVLQERRTTIYRLRDGGSRLSGEGFSVERFRDLTPEHLRWTVRTATRRRWYPATAAVSWHPNWQALVDGRPVVTRQAKDSLIRLRVPAGSVRVELKFERSAMESLYNWISALTLAGVLAAMVSRRRQAMRSRAAVAAAAT
ncbi:MAG TPA: hypothetical protein VEC57_03320 [Candidatus Limnocylindrales bacterium]|nr:hypothetical protein [Candidatus Limnocylindrales bacterium]